MRALALLVAIATTTLPATSARADIDGDRFVSSDWGVSLRAPSNWQMSERTSYPNIVLWMTHQQPIGRMLLSVEVHPQKIDSKTYAENTREVLTRLGFNVRAAQRHPDTGAWYFDFDNCVPVEAPVDVTNTADCAGKVFMRQGFLVEGKIGYALTLAAADVYSRGRLLRSWDMALKTIKIDRADDQLRPPVTGNTAAPKAPAPEEP